MNLYILIKLHKFRVRFNVENSYVNFRFALSFIWWIILSAFRIGDIIKNTNVHFWEGAYFYWVGKSISETSRSKTWKPYLPIHYIIPKTIFRGLPFLSLVIVILLIVISTFYLVTVLHYLLVHVNCVYCFTLSRELCYNILDILN